MRLIGSHFSLIPSLLLLMVFSNISATAQSGEVLHGLSASELEKISRGEAVIRPAADYRKLALAVSDATADALRASVAALRPNYITEVITAFPATDAAAAAQLLRKLADALADPKSYVGIPYWSKRQQKTYDLFDKMEINSRATVAGGEAIAVLQGMEPFNDFHARYEYRLEGSEDMPTLRFLGDNRDPIIYSYRNFSAVDTGNMLWSLYAFRDGHRVVFYGVGAVNAFDLFGIFRERLESSFMGRVEAFFKFMFGKIQ